MIDLHCHILPGIDDGAADTEDAVAMAAQAEADGIATVCATPHIRHDHDVRIPELADRVTALNEELARRGVAVRVLVGGEVAETALGGLDRTELASVALNGGRWVLLEPAPGPLSMSMVVAAAELRNRGYHALIAHPERHLGEGAREVLTELVQAGALVQVTAAFIEDVRESPLHDLARRGLVHVLGSDSHSARVGRPVRLSGGFEGLAGVESIRDHLTWVSEVAPAVIVEGEDVDPPFGPS